MEPISALGVERYYFDESGYRPLPLRVVPGRQLVGQTQTRAQAQSILSQLGVSGTIEERSESVLADEGGSVTSVPVFEVYADDPGLGLSDRWAGFGADAPLWDLSAPDAQALSNARVVHQSLPPVVVASPAVPVAPPAPVAAAPPAEVINTAQLLSSAPPGVSDAWAQQRVALMNEVKAQYEADRAQAQAQGRFQHSVFYSDENGTTETLTLDEAAFAADWQAKNPTSVAALAQHYGGPLPADALGLALRGNVGLYEGSAPAGHAMASAEQLAQMDGYLGSQMNQVLIGQMGGGPVPPASSGLAQEQVRKYGQVRYELLARLERALAQIQGDYAHALEAARNDPTHSAPGWSVVTITRPVQIGYDGENGTPLYSATQTEQVQEQQFSVEAFSRAYVSQASVSQQAFGAMYGVGKELVDRISSGGENGETISEQRRVVFELSLGDGGTRQLELTGDRIEAAELVRLDLNGPPDLHDQNGVVWDPRLGWVTHRSNLDEGTDWFGMLVTIVIIAVVSYVSCGAASGWATAAMVEAGAAAGTATFVGAVVGGAAAGAASAAVSGAINGNFSWSNVLRGMALGAVGGGLTYGAGQLAQGAGDTLIREGVATGGSSVIDHASLGTTTPGGGYQIGQNFTIPEGALSDAVQTQLVQDAQSAYRVVNGIGRIVNAGITAELGGGDAQTNMLNALSGVAGENIGIGLGGDGTAGRVIGAFVTAELADLSGHNGVSNLINGMTNLGINAAAANRTPSSATAPNPPTSITYPVGFTDTTSTAAVATDLSARFDQADQDLGLAMQANAVANSQSDSAPIVVTTIPLVVAEPAPPLTPTASAAGSLPPDRTEGSVPTTWSTNPADYAELADAFGWEEWEQAAPIDRSYDDDIGEVADGAARIGQRTVEPRLALASVQSRLSTRIANETPESVRTRLEDSVRDLADPRMTGAVRSQYILTSEQQNRVDTVQRLYESIRWDNDTYRRDLSAFSNALNALDDDAVRLHALTNISQSRNPGLQIEGNLAIGRMPLVLARDTIILGLPARALGAYEAYQNGPVGFSGEGRPIFLNPRTHSYMTEEQIGLEAASVAMLPAPGSVGAGVARSGLTMGPAAAERFALNLAVAERASVNSSNEILSVVSRQNGEVIAQETLSSTGGMPSALTIEAMRGNVVTHNHPSGGPLGFDDIRTAIGSGAREFRATGPETTRVLDLSQLPPESRNNAMYALNEIRSSEQAGLIQAHPEFLNYSEAQRLPLSVQVLENIARRLEAMFPSYIKFYSVPTGK
jgi:hypothetical protein